MLSAIGNGPIACLTPGHGPIACLTPGHGPKAILKIQVCWFVKCSNEG